MNINRIKRSVLVGVLAAATALSAPAFAGGWHGGGGGWHGRGGGWGGGAGWWGLGLGLGLGYTAAVVSNSYYYPRSYYYPATTYYYPATTYYAPAPVYQYQPAPVYQAAPVQTSAVPPPPAQASSDWYYCRTTQAYYPNVRTCNVPWQQVPATPPGRIN